MALDLDLDRLAQLRNELGAHEDELDAARAALRTARDAERAAQRADDTIGATAQRVAFASAAQRHDDGRAAHDATLDAIETLRRAAEDGLADPELRLDEHDAGLPALLLPLRIETRFLPVDGDPVQLVVRIYPDEVHIDDHEPALTAAEEQDGRDYWTAAWRAGPAGDDRPAWERLRDLHGGPRAAWIARSTLPRNQVDRPPGTVDADEPLLPEPDFPAPPRRPDGSSRAARVAWLPDRFAAVGYVGDEVAVTAWGEPVAERLLVGPVEDPLAEDAPDELAPAADVDELDMPELRWLTDLDSALDAGMAIRITVDARTAAGLDRLVVVGVRADAGPTSLAGELERLLDAHAHTTGAEIAAAGRATNDAAGPPPAPPPPAQPADAPVDGDAQRLAMALGIDEARTAALTGARPDDPARAMNALLWPSTLGYFLEQLALPAIGDDDVDAARRWFIDHVRARGPLPTLVVGAQPYGILPLTLGGRLAPADPFAARLAGLLARLRGWWREAATRAPHLGRGDDPEADLNEVLGQAPVLQRLRIREGLGRHYLENLYRHPATAAPISEQALDQQRVIANALLSTLADTRVEARVAEIGLRARSSLFRAPLVAAQPSTETLEDDYLGATRDALTGATPSAATRGLAQGGPLLARLARHGALLSLADGSGRVLADVRGRRSRVLMEAELVDVERSAGTSTSARRLDQRVEVGGVRSAVEVLVEGARRAGLGRAGSFDAAALAELVRDDGHRRHAALLEYEWALARLAEQTTESLDLLLREGLDSVSHRLDAWLTSLAWARLGEQRAVAPAGVHLGAYGIVEQLRPAARLTAAEPDDRVADEGPLFTDAGGGYVHAPSLDQAAAAAVLRAGHLAHGRGEAFAVDLSSARVRAALAVIEALRAGHPLGAVLGYRFERRLHELGLDRYVPVFRALAPLHGEAGSGAEQIADGLGLRRAFAERERLAQHRLPGRAPDDPRFVREPALDRAGFVSAVGGLVDELDELVDAVSDLMLADAAHASVQGNQGRARAIADAARSGTLPPEPEVARTPRTGVAFSNRLAVAMNADDGAAPGWPAAAGQPRQLADPRLDRWAGAVLGDPAALSQRLRVTSPDGAESATTVTVSDLGLCALDVVYGVRGAGADGRSELDARFVRAAAAAALAGSTIEPDADPAQAPWRALAAELHGLLAVARALAPADLVAPGDEPGTLDGGEWLARADAVAAALVAAADELLAALDAPADVDRLLAATERLADFGLVDGIVDSARDRAADPRRAAGDVLLDARARLERHEVATAPDERIAALLGDDVRSAPLIRAGRPDELAATLARSGELQGGDELAAAGWLAGIGRARPEADRLARVLALGDALHGAGPELVVGQLPHDPDPQQRWIGLPIGARAPHVELALAISSSDALDPQRPIAGLLVDAWADVVPRADETTAVALHYDRPSAEAPNCALLAVHPGDAEAWDLQTLAATVVEAAELARVRAVDLQSLQMVGSVLPATYLPRNVTGDTLSLDFTRADFDARLFAELDR